MSPALRFTFSFLAMSVLASGCGSTAPAAGDAGGPVTDASDPRCIEGGAVVPAQVGQCMSGGDDGAAPSTDFGATIYNSSGYDDDCKYHVSFTSTPVRRNTPVTFTVTVEGLDPAGPALGANLYAEVYLPPIHPAPNSNTKTTEKGAGVYDVGPIVFDVPGLWTVRFHMYEECSDAPEDSPHGHIAFYIDVP
jgi:hypothetical protein